MKRPRDNQRKKVYLSEWSVIDHLKSNGTYRQIRIDNIHSIRNWVATVENSDFWEKYCFINPQKWGLFHGAPRSEMKIQVKDGRGRRTASGSLFSISLPKWSRDHIVILHELAHTATMRRYGYYEHAPHGPVFCRYMLELLKRFTVYNISQLLYQSMIKNKVDIAPTEYCFVG